MSELTFNTENIIRERFKQPVKTHDVPVFNLVDENHPILKEVLTEFKFENPIINPNTFASSLVETCKKYKGLGLSANQCGFKHRVFVMGVNEEFVAFFNPVVLSHSKDTAMIVEGCLSFPDLYLKINRPETIEVEYLDFTGTKHQKTFTGLSARVFLHELDHLNGITFITKMKPLALKMAKDKRTKNKLKRTKLIKLQNNKQK